MNSCTLKYDPLSDFIFTGSGAAAGIHRAWEEERRGAGEEGRTAGKRKTAGEQGGDSRLQVCRGLADYRCATAQLLTCVLGPAEDGGDLVALGGVALSPHRCCAHPHRALVGLHPTQVCCGRARTVRHLGIGVVCLEGSKGQGVTVSILESDWYWRVCSVYYCRRFLKKPSLE